VHTLTALVDILRATGFSDVALLPDVLDFIGAVARTAANGTTSVAGPGVQCLSILSQVAQDNGFQEQANKVLQIVLMNAYAGSLPGEIPLTTATDRIHAKVLPVYPSSLVTATNMVLDDDVTQCGLVLADADPGPQSFEQHQQTMLIALTLGAQNTPPNAQQQHLSATTTIDLSDAAQSNVEIVSGLGHQVNMVLSCPGCTAPRPTPTEGLIMSLPLLTDLTEETGQHNTAEWVSSSEVASKFDQEGLYFDGASHIRVPSLANYDWGGKMTVSFLFKRTWTQGYMGMVGNGFNTEGTFEIRGSSQRAGTVIGGGVSDSDGVKPQKWDFATTASVGVWHHAALTYADNVATFYLDGDVMTSTIAMEELAQVANPLYTSELLMPRGSSLWGTSAR